MSDNAVPAIKEITPTPTWYKHFVKRMARNMLGFTSIRVIDEHPAIVISVTEDGIHFVRFHQPEPGKPYHVGHDNEQYEFDKILAECSEFYQELERLKCFPYLIVSCAMSNEALDALALISHTKDYIDHPRFIGKRAGGGMFEARFANAYAEIQVEGDMYYYASRSQLFNLRTGRML